MSVGSRIKEAREHLGLTQEQLAKLIGVTKGAIGNYETDLSHPKIEILYKLFAALKCNANFLFQDEMYEGDCDTDFKFTLPEQTHIKKYRALDEHGKEVVDNLLNSEHNRIIRLEQARREKEEIVNLSAAVDEDEPETIEMKVYWQPAAAGLGNYLDDDGYDLMTFPVDEIPSRADFGIRISGDSMEPKISDGDIVWIEAMPQIKNGEIGIFILDGDALCKKLHVELDKGIVELISLNYPKHQHKRLRGSDELRTVGKVLL